MEHDANYNKNKTRFASALMFLLPFMALTNPAGMSVVQVAVLVAFFLFFSKGLSAYYRAHFPAIRWIVFGFAGYFLVSALRVIVSTRNWPPMDGPFRLLFALSCIGIVGWLRPSARAFWLGACLGAMGAAAIALFQYIALGYDRPTGFTHHAITFGDLAIALGLLGFCGLCEFRKTRLAWLPVAALLCGSLASLLSGSRGGWLALPLAAIPLLRYGRPLYGRMIGVAGAVVVAGTVVACQVPGVKVGERIGLVYTEARQYVDLGDASTSVGIRLELWKASWVMFSENPIFGVGRSEFKPTLRALAQRGVLKDGPALEFASSHNDILHFLATGGIVDFSLLMVIYLAPLVFFLRILRRGDHPARPPALAGVVTVMCFIIFGLTDVMFWLMTPKIFYAMMVCVLVGYCLAAVDKHQPLPAPSPAA